MKKFLAIVALCTLLCNVYAATVRGSFGALKGESRARIEANYDKAIIYGMDEQAFASAEKDWEKDKPEILEHFMEGIQKTLGRKFELFTSTSVPGFIIRINIVEINTTGACLCDVLLVDQSGAELGRLESISGEAKGGTKLRRIKNSAEDAGLSIGKLLKKAIKKS